MEIYNHFIDKLEDDALKDICHTLNKEILTFPHLKILKKFNLPFFYGKTWICYLNLIKKKEIELCFVRGRELQSKELLDFKKRSMIGGLTYRTIDDIDFGVLKLLLEEAVALDNNKPYTFVKRKKK